MNSFSNLIRSFDVYSKTVNFRYGKKENYETFLGGFLSLTLLALLIYLLYNISFERINNLNPNVSFIEGYDKDNEFEVGSSSFQLILIPSYDDGFNNISNVYDSELIQIVVEKASYVTYTNGTKIRKWDIIPLKPCDIGDFDENIQKDFFLSKFNYGLCLADRNFTFKGVFESEIFKFLKISIIDCNNYKNWYDKNQVCKPRSDLLNALNKIRFSLIYTYSKLDTNNYKKPIYSIFNNQQILLSNTTLKRTNYFISPNILSTDDDLLFNLPFTNNVTYVNIGDIKDDFTISSDQGLAFFHGFFRIYPDYEIVVRTYKKIPTILAEAGSMISYLNFILIYVIGFYNERKFELCLINHLLCYDDNKMKNDVSQKIVKREPVEMKILDKLPKIKRFDSNLNLDLPTFKRVSIKHSSYHYTGNNANNRFSSWNFFLSGCKKKSKNHELLHKMKSMISSFLNIKNFIVLQQEFTILKDYMNKSHEKETESNRNKNSVKDNEHLDNSISKDTS
jgi:hypothetical protein